MRGFVAVLLTWLLFADSLPAKPHAQEPAKPTVKEQMLEVPAGSVIEIRLRTKEKFRGRLGEISNNTFTVKFAQSDRIEERKIAFEDLKSFKVIESSSKAGRIALYVLAGVGITFSVVFLVFAMAARD